MANGNPPHRPSKYKAQYCGQLIDHMAGGLSFESFAGVIEVGRATVYRWLDDYEDFRDAKEKGEAKSLLFWERMGVDGSCGRIKGFNAMSYQFNKKNRFNWKDKQEVSGPNNEPVQIKFTGLEKVE